MTTIADLFDGAYPDPGPEIPPEPVLEKFTEAQVVVRELREAIASSPEPIISVDVTDLEVLLDALEDIREPKEPTA